MNPQIIAIIAIVAPLMVAFGAVMWRLGNRVSLIEKAVIDNEAAAVRRDLERKTSIDAIQADVRALLHSQTLAEGIRLGIAQAEQKAAHIPIQTP